MVFLLSKKLFSFHLCSHSCFRHNLIAVGYKCPHRVMDFDNAANLQSFLSVNQKELRCVMHKFTGSQFTSEK